MVRCYAWIALAIGVSITGCGGSSPALDFGNVEAITLRVDEDGDYRHPVTVESSEPGKIEALLAVFRKGELAKEHKCADSGEITLRRKGGGKQVIGVLAGHNSRYYEIRVYPTNETDWQIYRVERTPFLNAMAGFGLEKLDRGGPE
jgi:hypothetical protein